MSLDSEFEATRAARQQVILAEKKFWRLHRKTVSAMRRAIKQGYSAAQYAVSTPFEGGIRVRERSSDLWVTVYLENDVGCRLKAGSGDVLYYRCWSHSANVLGLVAEGFRLAALGWGAKADAVSKDWQMVPPPRERGAWGACGYCT